MMAAPFTTADEVKLYASGDRITCLECGKGYAMLCTHLRVHGMNEASYREKYNIPPTVRLTGAGVRRKMRESNHTPHDILRERAKHATRIASHPHKLFNQRVADLGRGVAAAKKTKLDVPRVKAAHAIYMQDTQRAACRYLGVSSPTLHKWFDRLSLPKKCPIPQQKG